MLIYREGAYPVEHLDDAPIPEGYAVAPAKPPYDPRCQMLGWRGTDWHVEDIPLGDVKMARLAVLAGERWRREVAGIQWTRADGTVYWIATDTEKSQGKLAAERQAAVSGLRQPGDVWKCGAVATGSTVFIEFTDAEIIAIADQARAYVSSTFKHEGALAAAINAAETAAAVLAVDITDGWPE